MVKLTPYQFKILCGIGAVLILGAIANQTEHQAPPPTQAEISAKQEDSDSIDAQVAAKQFVEARLKAPSTAKWQSSGNVAVAKVKGSKNTWLVNGYVDSQNSYGAMLRMTYWATVSKKKDATWSLVKLQTEP